MPLPLKSRYLDCDKHLKNMRENAVDTWKTTIILTYVVMVNFDWSVEWLYIWSNSILHVSVGVFLDEINIWNLLRLSKTHCCPYVGGPRPISWGARKNKRLTFLWVRGNSSCLIALSWDISFFVLSDLKWNIGSSQVLKLPAFSKYFLFFKECIEVLLFEDTLTWVY